MLKRGLLFDFIHRICGHAGITRERSILKQPANKTVFEIRRALLAVQRGTLVRPVAAAMLAMPAGRMRIDDDLVSRRKPSDRGTDFGDLSGILVPKNDIGLRGMQRRVHQYMQVRPANAHAQYLDEYLVRVFNLRLRSILVRVYARLLEYNCFHDMPPKFPLIQ
jgi:hypothetical protein